MTPSSCSGPTATERDGLSDEELHCMIASAAVCVAAWLRVNRGADAKHTGPR